VHDDFGVNQTQDLTDTVLSEGGRGHIDYQVAEFNRDNNKNG
jgi:hypothetical protein